jgi:iron complex transport system ATP-binding protein
MSAEDQIRMLDLLAEEATQARRCIVLSLHDLSLAQRVATHVLLLGASREADTPLAGPAAEMLTENRLSAAFGHRLHRHEAEGRVWWLPA